MKLFPKMLTMLVPVFLSGCIFTAKSYYETKTYDLQPPADAKFQSVVTVRSFRNMSPTRTRMLYRENSTGLVADEYNNWVQTPELLLQRYLTAAFPAMPGSNREQMVQLSGTVETFEIDLTQPAAVLHIEYQLAQGSRTFAGSIVISEPAERHDPAAYAEAMTRAAARTVQELTGAISRFQNGK